LLPIPRDAKLSGRGIIKGEAIVRIHEGKLNGEGLRVGIVVSRFNHVFTRELLEGALDRFLRLGVREEDIHVAWVPGAFELPRGVKALAESGEVDGIVALAAVIRGATPHFEYVAAEVAKGIAKLSLELPVPITFGVITADAQEQALERAGGKLGNKGAQAAEALVEMIRLEEALAEGEGLAE